MLLDISDWIKSEELCDFDVQNHHMLVECHPLSAQERAERAESLHRDDDGDPHELTDMQDAIGEDIDEAIEDVSQDRAEPTEAQKRELFKIHRNLGHPALRELGRALKHAGAKRHLIRWAMKELRCPVCESRARPNTRRPGVLPRSMKLNQTVGCDLFEFDEFGYKTIVLKMICWGTGYQQACRVPDKSSA